MAKRRLKPPKRQNASPLFHAQREFFLSWNKKRTPPAFKGKIVILSIMAAFCLGVSVNYVFQQRIGSSPPQSQSVPLHHTQACFTPGQACLPLIQQALAAAQQTIHLQAYTFTQRKMTDSLIQATKRGVKVIVILDKSQRTARFSQYTTLKASSIAVFFDTKPAIAHNKVIIIDNKILITGSYNFSQAAETKNAENLLIIHSPELAALYETNFQKRLKESKKEFYPSPSR